ncbi:4Fe-4S dicluster domain-containing protein [bacterium]|nr:4Fe-4S dicluster domain-containing protein [candidate division CSSED10-310 bacterium]
MDHTFFHALIVSLAIPGALYPFIKAVHRKFALLQKSNPVPDPISEHRVRVKELLSIFLGQQKLFQDFKPGIMHAVIFWGFLALLLRAITLFMMCLFGFQFHLPLLGSNQITGRLFSLITGMATVSVLIMVIYAMYRRYVQKVKRLINTWGAAFVLGMIAMLMITDLLFDGVFHGIRNTGFLWYSPFGSTLGILFAGSSGIVNPAMVWLGHFCIVLHCLGILAFLVYLPSGKHMHILTSVFNVYLRPLHRTGRLVKLDLDDETIESFGIEKMDDHTWKDVLDLYTCTECGRCNDQCPAALTGKSLAPREITIAENHFLQDEDADRILTGCATDEPVKQLIPDVVSEAAIWECTTCHACEQACPVNIGYVHRIIGLRRAANLNRGEFPKELKRVFKGMENNSNPWNIGASKRGDWASDLDIPFFSDTPNAEFLLYPGCAGSFDDRAIKVTKTLVQLLRKLNISFAILGSDETCCGETARRLGEEALGQSLIHANIELFNELGVKSILTTCPHCYNTFKNEYPDFGGNFKVIHHSQLLAGWVRNNPIFPAAVQLQDVTIHDPCYLGRVNGDYDSARSIINGISGLITTETEKNRSKSMCCGAGGGMFWMEETGERINHSRFDELMVQQPSQIAVSCPYCLIMLSDAAKDKQVQDAVKVQDVAEILLSAIDR